MTFRFWDMDHTIIDNDCDVSWKEFLISTGKVDPAQQLLVDRFYQEYEQGVLRVDEFVEFQLTEFRGQTQTTVQALTREHFEAVVRAKIYGRAAAMIRAQLAAGDFVCLLTATNLEIARPLAELLRLSHVIATDLEMVDGRYTGRIAGTYCCAEGKLSRLQEYCGPRAIDLSQVHYYGDSTSDLFVLEAVGFPHATNPMPKLRSIATANGWDILDFK